MLPGGRHLTAAENSLGERRVQQPALAALASLSVASLAQGDSYSGDDAVAPPLDDIPSLQERRRPWMFSVFGGVVSLNHKHLPRVQKGPLGSGFRFVKACLLLFNILNHNQWNILRLL